MVEDEFKGVVYDLDEAMLQLYGVPYVWSEESKDDEAVSSPLETATQKGLSQRLNESRSFCVPTPHTSVPVIG